MTNVLGAILAGGKSSRFGDGNKALAMLAGKPLIQHVIRRLQPQVSDIIFSGEQYELANVEFNAPAHWISDIQPGQRGPLVGLLSCLKHIQETDSEWLLTSACDTPLLPADLVENLLKGASSEGVLIAAAHDGKRLQPANALWHRDLYPQLKTAVEDSDMQGFHQFLDTQPHAIAEWPNDGNYFINLNTQLDLANANALLRSHSQL